MFQKFHISRRQAFSVVLLIAIVCGSYVMYDLLTFRVTGTDPNTNSVAAASSYINISFNKTLNEETLKIRYSDKIVLKRIVANKTVTLQLVQQGLEVNKTYTVYLDHVESNSGKIIEGKLLTFTAKDVAFDDMSDSQKNAAIASQDKFPYEPQHIQYVGFNRLLDNGLTSEQLLTTERYLYDYSKSIKKEFREMTLVDNSLKAEIHNSTSSSTNDTLNFQAKLGKDTYQAVIVSDPFTGDMRFTLANSMQTVFDSDNFYKDTEGEGAP